MHTIQTEFFIGLRNCPADALRTNGKRHARYTSRGTEHGVLFRTHYSGDRSYVCPACLLQDKPAVTFVEPLRWCAAHPDAPRSRYELSSDVVGVDEADLFEELRVCFGTDEYTAWLAEAPKREAEKKAKEEAAAKAYEAEAAAWRRRVENSPRQPWDTEVIEARNGPYRPEIPHNPADKNSIYDL